MMDRRIIAIGEPAPIVFIVRRSSRLTIMDPRNPKKLLDATATIDELKAMVDRFVQERSWNAFHLPKNLAMSVAIEAAELMEHFQWNNPETPTEPLSHDSAVAQELSDVIAYSLALANVLGIDVSQAMEFKMERNKLKYPVGKEYIPKGISSPE